MGFVLPFSEEQLRLAVNLEQHYEVWIEAERTLIEMPYGMKWKTVSGRDYLYEVIDRNGNAKGAGPRSPDTEAVYQDYRRRKEAIQSRRETSAARLAETCRLYRAARLPLLSNEGAKVLREADRRTLLGSHFIVVGTNAMPAYSLEAGGRIDAPDETDDFDVTWTAQEARNGDRPFWTLLQAVDDTYSVNSERPFQARNAKAHEVELLIAPSRTGAFTGVDRPRPVPLDEQEWLLNGRTVSRVVVARDGSPARIVAPDPRWFALQKLWMADQHKRNPLKRPKDARQAVALLNAVASTMPQFPLDDEFEESLPPELKEPYDRWKADRPEVARGLGW